MIRTERLVLRPLTAEDLPLLAELDRDAEVVRYVGGPSTWQTLPAGDWWVAEEDGAFVGWFFLRDGELGYRLKRSAWGRGLATEGARAVLALAEGPVYADAVKANVGSGNVLRKLGFRVTREGVWKGMPDLHFERE